MERVSNKKGFGFSIPNVNDDFAGFPGITVSDGWVFYSIFFWKAIDLLQNIFMIDFGFTFTFYCWGEGDLQPFHERKTCNKKTVKQSKHRKEFMPNSVIILEPILWWKCPRKLSLFSLFNWKVFCQKENINLKNERCYKDFKLN